MIRIPATGYEDYIEEDRTMLYASPGAGNGDGVQIHLEISDPEQDVSVMAWFKVADLAKAIQEALAWAPLKKTTKEN